MGYSLLTGPMIPRFHKGKPTFFWQGALLMLPVLTLAVIGLVSLRRDQQAAEAEGRRRAAESVKSLAQAIRSIVNDEFQRFLLVESPWAAIENENGPRMESEPLYSVANNIPGRAQTGSDSAAIRTNKATGNQPQRMLLKSYGFPQPEEVISRFKAGQTRAENWESLHPGLKLEALASVPAKVAEDGRQLEPPEVPLAPEPPKWFRELTPHQRELWQALRSQSHGLPREGGNQQEKVHLAYQAFLGSVPGEEAKRAAGYLQLSPDKLLSSPPLKTESGVSFQELACYRLLQQQMGSSAFPGPILDAVWDLTVEEGCVLSPELIQLAENLAASFRYPAARYMEERAQDQVRWIRRCWESQTRTREWLAALRESRDWGTEATAASPATQWVSADCGEALAFMEPATFRLPATNSATSSNPVHGFEVLFAPREFIMAIFAKGISENQFLVPGYAAAEVSVEGVPLHLTASGERGRGVHQDQEPLGSASQKFGKYPAQDSAGFDVKLYLTSRDLMLATEQRRGKLFEGLIVASSFAALVGLAAAYRAFQRQLRLNEMKSNFVSSVSHELRAPIASVRLMAESLEGGRIAEAPKQREYFRFIGKECRRLSALIENVLDFSRIEQGRKQYDFEPTDVLALTQATVTLMQTYAAEREVKLELRVEGRGSWVGEAAGPVSCASAPSTPDSRPSLLADGKALQQALVNLIDNAIKHSTKGQTVTVGLEVQRPSSGSSRREEALISSHEKNGASSRRLLQVLIWVEDHGEGIPPQEHERIFERFYRLGSELRRETQGVGIGLSIVKHVVEAHGGRVVVRSAVGQGSRFTIELPMNCEIRSSKPE
ncbi:MAG: hypothetical protein C5B50_03430 [Verrucomicrobia bacterium]|nr:MAG: hypothetical protein C5B50_03430 [Verrucomicrobiota bacterium]